jgi:REP element-mobilizing transposase RayT
MIAQGKARRAPRAWPPPWGCVASVSRSPEGAEYAFNSEIAMAQSLSNVLLHIVFSTKNRQPWINVDIEEELFKYIAGTCQNLDCPSHKIGGADDHIHIACSLARTMAISKLLEEIKTSSSKWMKTKGDEYAEFAWQNGYGEFSIGQSHPALSGLKVSVERRPRAAAKLVELA